MAAVTAFDAKTRFGGLLDRVAAGEEIVITRHDKPVARIVREGAPRLDDVRRVVEALQSLQLQIAERCKRPSRVVEFAMPLVRAVGQCRQEPHREDAYSRIMTRAWPRR